MLLVLGIAVFTADHHGHRIGAVLAVLSLVSLVVGLVVLRAARGD
jgi:hypothetical protein